MDYLQPCLKKRKGFYNLGKKRKRWNNKTPPLPPEKGGRKLFLSQKRGPQNSRPLCDRWRLLFIYGNHALNFLNRGQGRDERVKREWQVWWKEGLSKKYSSNVKWEIQKKKQ